MSTPFPRPSIALPLESWLKKGAAEQSWIIEDIIPKGGLINLFAPPKAGKSYLALDLALALAQGKKSWLTFDILEPGPVLYFQLDTPSMLWRERYWDLEDAGVDINSNGKMLEVDREMVEMPFDIMTPGSYDVIRNEVAVLKPVLVIIDTIREVHNEDEDKSGEMKQVVSTLQHACAPSAVMVISHTRKRNSTSKNKSGSKETGAVDLPNITDQNRGSGYLAGKADTLMWLMDDGMLMYKGRAFETNHLNLERNENTVLWELNATAKHQMAARSLVRTHWEELRSGACSQASLARVLMTETKQLESSAKSDIRRQYKRLEKDEKRRLRRLQMKADASV